jgi:SAM-dependent methyltransferase
VRGLGRFVWLYDAGMSCLERLGLGAWRLELAAGARGRTLDLGCGTGRSLPHLPPGDPAVGADPCFELLRAARRRRPRVPLVCARAEELPFGAGVFGTVLSALVFCSVEAPSRGLAEIGRVLAPGGELRMLEHVRSDGFVARLQDLSQPVWTRLTGGCHPNRETERSVRDSGFGIDAATRRVRGSMRLFSARRPDGGS